MVAVRGHHRRARGYRLDLVEPGVYRILEGAVALIGVVVGVVAARQHQERVYGGDLGYNLLRSRRQAVLPPYQTSVSEVDHVEVGRSRGRRRPGGVDLAPSSSVASDPVLVGGGGF